MPANVFVLGLDDLNRRTLQDLPDRSRYRFHPLLRVEELMRAKDIALPELLEQAQDQLNAFDDTVDAIIGYWDFPVSSMVPLLCERFGLPTPGLRAVAKCEHKYWSRLEQRKVIDEHPSFALVDLDNPREPVGVGFPMWLKPVKSASSELAFQVGNAAEFQQAVQKIKSGVGRVGQPFDFVLSQLDLPPEITEVGGQACLAEEAVPGAQLTVEGYCKDGETHVYGVIDSLCYPDSPSFLCYRYPSRVPEEVTERLATITARVIRQIGLEPAAFNVEFFWDPGSDRVTLLEVNPRLSQSHAKLFEYVDGIPHHHCAVRLALGRDPHLPHREGPYAIAAKWFLRSFTDGTVLRSPSAEEIDRLREAVPGVDIEVVAQPGRRLSDLRGQDSYSYELAHIHIGAHSETELEAKYDRCAQALHFELNQ